MAIIRASLVTPSLIDDSARPLYYNKSLENGHYSLETFFCVEQWIVQINEFSFLI